MNFDFQNFAQQLTPATQAAFTELLARHPTEAFYRFALSSDEGAMTVCPAANTLGPGCPAARRPTLREI